MKSSVVAFLVCMLSARTAPASAGDLELGASLGYRYEGGRMPLGPPRMFGSSAAFTFFQRLPVSNAFGVRLGGGPTGRAFIGYRFLDGAMSLGLSGSLTRTSATAAYGDVDALAGVSYGIYARTYALRSRVLDGWISIGVEWSREKLTLHDPRSSDIHLTHYGLGLPLTIALEARVTPRIAIGPSFQLNYVVGRHGCYDGPQSSNLDPNTGLLPRTDCTEERVLDAQDFVTFAASVGMRASL